jgi:alpha-beta hydrolase superfamily lysophospholipase
VEFKHYSSESVWKKVSELLPANNRIDENNKPTEYYWSYGDYSIHIDHYYKSHCKAKVILLHGVGGNGRLLSFIAVPLYKRGFEVIAPDLPGYGLTYTKDTVTYEHWLEVVNALIDEELRKDDRPIFLFGFSAGGMLSYQAACVNKKVSGLIVTNLLDQRIQEVRDCSAISKTISRLGTPLLKLTSKLNHNIKIPMKLIANMKAIVNDKKLLKLLLKDKLSSGTKVSVKFILTLLDASPVIEPHEFKICPLLLVHPANDRWTPVKLSLLFFNRLKCEKELLMLQNAGHFPIEEPGISQLEDYSVNFINEVISRINKNS